MITKAKTGLPRKQRKLNRAAYAKQHPVLSGAVPVVNYVPPVAFYNGVRVS